MHGRCCARWLVAWFLTAGTGLAFAQYSPNPRDNLDGPFAGSHARLPQERWPQRIWHQPLLPRPVPLPPVTVGFQPMAQAAGIIFSGTVTAIAPIPASGKEVPQVVAITFRVERAFRGSSPGQNLTIFQWIGVWTSGQRYRVGEHVLLFLYPPSKLGLTSCVGGSLGRFALDPSGHVVLTEEHIAAFGADPVLGGKSRVSMRDFAQAVRRARGEE